MTHLAIGDFVYQGPHLQALKNAYPDIQLDIWIDDLRSQKKAWHAGRNVTLCQWLEVQPFIDGIYPIAETIAHRHALIEQAKQQRYDVIFFIATHRSDLFAKYARAISRTAFVAGTRARTFQRSLQNWWRFKHVDAHLNERSLSTCDIQHISDLYGVRFYSLVGVKSDVPLLPITPPSQWLEAAKVRLADVSAGVVDRWVLINHLSTAPKRDLSWSKTAALLKKLHRWDPRLGAIINLPPDQFEALDAHLRTAPPVPKMTVVPFTAGRHFYELAAMISCVDYVITVETAIMHLASSLGTPQTAMVRTSATQWRPLGDSKIIECRDSIDTLNVEHLAAQVTDHFPR